jgi:hypothetical protein
LPMRVHCCLLLRSPQASQLQLPESLGLSRLPSEQMLSEIGCCEPAPPTDLWTEYCSGAVRALAAVQRLDNSNGLLRSTSRSAAAGSLSGEQLVATSCCTAPTTHFRCKMCKQQYNILVTCTSDKPIRSLQTAAMRDLFETLGLGSRPPEENVVFYEIYVDHPAAGRFSGLQLQPTRRSDVARRLHSGLVMQRFA